MVPNAKAPKIVKLGERDYKVKVNARAAEGKANKRLIEILAEYFDVPESRVRIVRGLAGRKKVVRVEKPS